MGSFSSISGNLTTITISGKVVKWNTDDSFDKGSFTTSEIAVTGNSVQLKKRSDNSDDFPFTNSANYTFDSSYIEFVSGSVLLKALTGTANSWLFSTASNYTYSTAEIEVTGGVAQLRAPIDATFYANYSTSVNGTWGDGTLNGAATGGASVSGGELDLTGSASKYVDYDANLNADSQQTGCIRFLVRPDYSGSPASTQVFVAISQAVGNSNNLIQVQQQTIGNIRFAVFDSSGSVLIAYNAASWSPVSGNQYEIELNWDITAGASRIFIDGVLQGTAQTATGTRNSSISLLRVGSNSGATVMSDFKIDDLVIYSTVQHTSNYVPGASIRQTKYLTTNPTIVPNTAAAFTSSFGTFTEVASKFSNDQTKYNLSSDNGTTYKVWNGAAWATSSGTYASANLASTCNTNIGSLDTTGNFKFKAFLHSDTGATTPELNSVTAAINITYSTGNQEVEADFDIQSTFNIQWLTFTETVIKPANTNVLYKYSTSSGATYNATWLTAASAQTAIQNIPSPGTLRVKSQLSTTDSSITPQLDNINITSDAGYVSSSTYTSNEYSSTILDNDWEEIDFTTTISSGQSIVISARSANTTASLSTATYSVMVNESNPDLVGKYLQWKADLVSTGSNTPMLNSVQFKFTTPAFTSEDG